MLVELLVEQNLDPGTACLVCLQARGDHRRIIKNQKIAGVQQTIKLIELQVFELVSANMQKPRCTASCTRILGNKLGRKMIGKITFVHDKIRTTLSQT